jgi:tetratricopeptide (TPR) repeat protein
MYRRCLASRRSVLGYDHLDVAEALTKVGNALFARGYHSQSIDMCLQALRIRRNHLPHNHIETARTYFQIGRLLCEIGDAQKSLTMMRKSLAIQEESLGEEHRETGLTYAYIALLLGQCEGDDDNVHGMQMAQKALCILQKSVGDDHPDTAFCFFVIATLLQEYSMDGALSMMDQCCKTQERVLGNQHPVLATTYCRLGEMFLRKARLRDSQSRFQQALSVLQQTHSHAHISIVRVYANLAVVASLLKQPEEACELHELVLDSLLACPIRLDQKLLLTYSAAAEQLYENGDRATALRLFRQTLEVKETMVGSDDPGISAGNKALDLLRECQGTGERSLLEQFRLSLAIPDKVPECEGDTELAERTSLVEGVTTQWLERQRLSF